MRAARTVLEAKAIHGIALLTEGGGSGCAGKARTHDNDGVLAAIGWIHQLHLEAGLVPLLFNWTGRNFGFKHLLSWGVPRFAYYVQRKSGGALSQCTQPASTEMGTEIKPAKIRIATILENVLRLFVF